MQNPASPPIVLASSSRYRQALLERFLDDFQAVFPNVDEAAESAADPERLAASLARKKPKPYRAAIARH